MNKGNNLLSSDLNNENESFKLVIAENRDLVSAVKAAKNNYSVINLTDLEFDAVLQYCQIIPNQDAILENRCDNDQQSTVDEIYTIKRATQYRSITVVSFRARLSRGPHSIRLSQLQITHYQEGRTVYVYHSCKLHTIKRAAQYTFITVANYTLSRGPHSIRLSQLQITWPHYQ